MTKSKTLSRALQSVAHPSTDRTPVAKKPRPAKSTGPKSFLKTDSRMSGAWRKK